MGLTSIWHWIILLIVVLVLFGKKNIPELAQSIAKGIKIFKKEMQESEEKPKKDDKEEL